MPYKDPEARKAYHRELMRKLREAAEYRAKEAELKATYYLENKEKLRPKRRAWKKTESGKKLFKRFYARQKADPARWAARLAKQAKWSRDKRAAARAKEGRARWERKAKAAKPKAEQSSANASGRHHNSGGPE